MLAPECVSRATFIRRYDLFASMHKDKPPGPFDIANRSAGYVIWLGLGTGFALSILVHLSYLLVNDNSAKQKAPWSPSSARAIPNADARK